MKKILLLLCLFSAVPGFGWKAYFSVTGSGGSPIPNAYSTSDTQSHTLTGLVNVFEICVFNDTGTRVVIDVFDGSTSPTTDTHKIPAYGFVCVTDPRKGPIMSTDLYIKGESSITSGEVFGFVN